MIADGEVADPGTEALDDPGALVAVHLRPGEELGWKFARQQVGVAHTGRHHPHQHLVVAGLLEFEVFDRERSVARSEYCGSYLHRSVSPSSSVVSGSLSRGGFALRAGREKRGRTLVVPARRWMVCVQIRETRPTGTASLT